MTPAEISNLAELAKAVQGFVVAIAIIIGGSWTLYTFVQLGTIRKAKAELSKLKIESSEQAIVSIDISAMQMNKNEGEGYVFSCKAIVSNKGNRNTLIDFTEPDSCTVTKIELSEEGYAIESNSFNIPFFMTYYLRAKATVSFPFVAKVKNSGVYQVMLKSPLHSHEAEQASTVSKIGEKNGYIWRGVEFVVVSDIS